MIKLNNILQEISNKQADLLLNKIKNKEFKFYARGDNGKVYSINGEDLLMKITTEPDEIAVADKIVGQYSIFNAFIPVIYSDSGRKMYIMKKANNLPGNIRNKLIQFYENYKDFARQQRGLEISIFDYLESTGISNIDPKISNFIQALGQQVKKTRIGDLELSLDFRPDNVMIWQGNLVMIDW